jgi:3',5'-cyclic AMP phosphodiesterase CpdA
MDEQIAWLDSDLQQAANDPEIDWIIALFHHAPYSACTVHGSTGRVQDKWVPLFDKHGVDFVFTGHDHNYERTVPIKNDAKAEEGEGTVYVVAGGFYSPGYTNGTDWWTVVSHHGDIRNFVLMEINGKTANLTAYDGKGGPGTTPVGQELDTYTLTKP